MAFFYSDLHAMQQDRYSSNNQRGQCSWCSSEYLPCFSRARSADLFCTRKCEIEARFWLVDQLSAIEKARKTDPEQN